jgi:hypothetical protein
MISPQILILNNFSDKRRKKNNYLKDILKDQIMFYYCLRTIFKSCSSWIKVNVQQSYRERDFANALSRSSRRY